MAIGVPGPGLTSVSLSLIIFRVFVIYASIGLWRRGGPRERRRAARVGGSLTVFVLIAVSHSVLVLYGVLASPYFISFPFLIPLMVMGYELGAEVVRAARLARELQASRSQLRATEQQMSLMSSAADLGVWEWDVEADRVRLADRTRTILGIGGSEQINLDHFLGMLHPGGRNPFARRSTGRF